MTEPARNDLIHDWNRTGDELPESARRLTFDDESLRDGLQSPSVRDPEIGEKIRILHLMERLGIHSADVVLPAAVPRAFADTLALVQESVTAGMKLRPNAAARTLVKDIEPIVDISQRTGRPVEVAMFIGSSPIRFYTEGWELSKLLGLVEEAVSYSVKNGIPVMFVTEDTTRATPENIRALYTAAIQAGAQRVTIADTVGHSTPAGVRAVVRFVREVADQAGDGVLLDWHGHNDRGLGVINTITAGLCGADQLHGTALGIGERCGNAAMDQLLVNLKLMGLIQNDLTALGEYCEAVSRAVGIEIPVNYPVTGRDAFRTATGVHAAAVIKAAERGDAWLEDLVYSAVPASMVGREQTIEIGPMSGMANVSYWLTRHGYDPAPEVVQAVFSAAKQAKEVLTNDEVHRAARDAGAQVSPGT